MSLINKMLQDLDARGGAGGKAGGESVRSVTSSGARTPAMLALRTGVALVALALAGWYGWSELRQPAFKPPKVLEPSAAVATPVAGPVADSAAVAGPAQAPAQAETQAPPSAGVVADSVLAAQQASRAARAERIEARRRQQGAQDQEPAQASAPMQDADLAGQLADAKRKAREARADARALAAAQAARTAQAPPRAAAKAAPAREVETSGVTVTSQQQGENAYKRALAALQDGRVQEALASLEQAVFAYPRHDGARQALVGLLLEARRYEEAMRHLQLGLGLDPKQQQMAMLLARLQIERGGPAVETLTRTLPYAGNNPDYLAFLAGALQKGQRHKEAVEQYQAALRLMPQNGVWWMGMGISLQADKRNAEAVDAYNRAKASGSLSAELASFVERKLAQMAR